MFPFQYFLSNGTETLFVSVRGSKLKWGQIRARANMSWETLLHYDKVGLSFVDSEVHDHSSLIPYLTRDGGLEYSEMRFPVLSASMSQIQVR